MLKYTKNYGRRRTEFEKYQGRAQGRNWRDKMKGRNDEILLKFPKINKLKTYGCKMCINTS